jgi:hypothetical protein
MARLKAYGAIQARDNGVPKEEWQGRWKELGIFEIQEVAEDSLSCDLLEMRAEGRGGGAKEKVWGFGYHVARDRKHRFENTEMGPSVWLSGIILVQKTQKWKTCAWREGRGS